MVVAATFNKDDNRYGDGKKLRKNLWVVLEGLHIDLLTRPQSLINNGGLARVKNHIGHLRRAAI